jgi:hypothetical protein
MPVLQFQFRAVAVPVNQHHCVILVVLDQKDPSVPGMPSADPDDGLGRQHAHRIVHGCAPRLAELHLSELRISILSKPFW